MGLVGRGAGVTLLTWRGPDGLHPEEALAGVEGVEALFRLDPVTQGWSVYRPGAPAFAQTLDGLQDQQPVLVVGTGGTWRLPAW